VLAQELVWEQLNLEGKGKDPMRPHAPLPDDETFIKTAQLLQRLANASHMQPERLMERDPSFPKPYYIGQRRYWRLGELRAWENSLSREPPPRRNAAAPFRRTRKLSRGDAAGPAADPSFLRG
jgi:hypothetical protein